MKLGTLLTWLSLGSLVLHAVEWQVVHPTPGLPALRSVAYGEGKFVTVGDNTVAYSTDAGRHWNPVLPPVPWGFVSYSAVTYANGRFIAVGGDQVVISEDGQNWTAHTVVSGANLFTIIFQDGLYVTTGHNGFIATSPDAQNWTMRPAPTANALKLLVYGNGRFLATDGDNQDAPSNAGFLEILTSTNSFDWSLHIAPLTYADPNCTPGLGQPPCFRFESIQGLIFDGQQFVGLANVFRLPGSQDFYVLTSPDGVTWTITTQLSATASSVVGFSAANSLAKENNTYFNLSQATATTALNNPWTLLSIPYAGPELFGAPDFEDVAFGDSTYVFVGAARGGFARVMRGTSLDSLERVDVPTGPFGAPNYKSVAASGNLAVAIGDRGELDASNDAGHTFNRVTPPDGTSGLNKVYAADGMFVAVGSNGTIIRSSNGTNWSKRLSNTSRHLQDITFGNGLWVAVGTDGAIVTSSDAGFFTLQNPNTQVQLHSVTYGNGLFVAVGDTGAILRSTNAETWTIYGTDDALNLNAVSFDNGAFVAVGADGIFHHSLNGIRWTSGTITNLPAAGSLTDVAGAGGIFIAIQAESAIAHTSTDGLNWQRHTLLKPLYGAEVSAGTVWVTGEAGYLAKATAAEIQISAVEVQSNSLTLTFTAPTPASYEVNSSDKVTGTWNDTFPLGQKSGTVVFTDPRPVNGARFYRVRLVP